MIEPFLETLRAAGKSEQTVTLRRYHLLRVESELGPLETRTTEALMSFMATPAWSREYRRSMRSTLRAYYGWLTASGRREDNPALDLPSVKPSPPAPRPTPQRAYDSALRSAPARVLLMIRLSAEAGLRRGEVAAIGQGDLIDDLLGSSLIVHGKGGKERIVPLSDDLARLVEDGLRESLWLFPSTDPERHLTAAHVGKLVSAELPAGVTMHSLRHRFATRVYNATTDLLTTQQLLGHSSPATTQAYVALDASRLRSAVAMAA